MTFYDEKIVLFIDWFYRHILTNINSKSYNLFNRKNIGEQDEFV